MAISTKDDVTVTEYTRRPFPALEGSIKYFIQSEFERIENCLNSLTIGSIQVTDAAPEKPLKGMVRYNTSPWFPLGGSTVSLVVYNGTAWVAV